ncbi:MAG: hypothetical protein J6A90_04850 [Clostridia bacterium]|nr:hypothetical protein [Clostridia bacterium]
MPIGKNAIKRISNNGYSNVTSSAPDMENSVVNEEKEIAPKKENSAKKTAPVSKISPNAGTKKAPSAKSTAPKPTVKKTTTKAAPKSTPAPKKSMEVEPTLSPVNTAKKVTGKTENKQDNGCIHIGGELPIHLL